MQFQKIIFLVLCAGLLHLHVFAQTYYHPTAGIQNTYAGNCEVNVCGGVYVDDGGTGGNYFNGVNNVYRTFCPNTAGQCIRLTFTQFSLEAPDFFGDCYDQLSIGSGPTQNSPVVWQGCGSSLPPAITSTDPSGCVTVRFISDGTVSAAGWRANITCVPCAGQGPSATLSNDCSNAQYVCDNLQPITANSQGPGLVSDACVSGCAVSENYSNWYILNVTAAGTMGFTITPTPVAADYDFTLYGPVTGGCSSLGAPVRCSYAANTGNTGMRAISVDASEDVTGDGWVSAANMSVGIYYLLINQWAYEPSSTFRLDFNGTAVIGLPPPLNLSSNSPVCADQSLQLNAPAVSGATYSWSGPGGWASTQRNPTRNPPVAGTYTFLYAVNGCNSSSGNISVTVNPVPAPSITPATASVCPGQSMTLTASGGTSYSWSNGATTAAITVTPASTTTYTVTATDAGGCTAAASRTVNVNANLVATITPSAPAICAGASTTLNAGGGTTYSWSTAATTASITVSPAATTTYSVTATNGASCTGTASATVTVNSNPVAVVSPASASICSGSNTTLTASGGSSYSWSNAATTASITVSPSSTTTYAVTVTNAAGCTATSSGTVTVNTIPTAAILPATASICSGSSATLTASGGSSYSWSNAATTASITVSPSSTTTYTVTVTEASGCTATASRMVTVNSAPAAAISPAAPAICTGTSTTLTASGGTFYSWSNSATTPGISVAPAVTTTYTVTVSDVNGCSATASSTVTVNAFPSAAISPATVAICSGASAALTASGGTSYSWSNAATTASITVNPATTTAYNVTVTDANGCTAATSRTVTVNTLPTASITPTTVSICTGATATLTANGGISYSWSNAATTAAIMVSPATTSAYTVTITDASGCTATASRTITVNASPPASVSPSSVSVCNGSSATLTASGGTSYSWSNAAITSAITVTPVATTTYSVTVTDANSCSATASATVNVNTLPVAAISPATVAICSGASAALTASGGTSYSWSNAATTASITVNPATTTAYSVTVTDANGCTAAVSRTVTVNPLPTTSITPATVSICNGASATLTAGGGTLYSWSNGATSPSITVNPSASATYSVTITDNNGCTGTASRGVTVNVNPTAGISPAALAICSGTNSILTASGGTAYSWSNAATTASTNISPAVSTSYSVTVSNANNCTAAATRLVTVNPLPTASVTPVASSICPGGSALLTASGGISYLWNNAATTASITVSPAATASYSVSVTDANGCTASATGNVTVNPLPIASISPAAAAICEGASATLTANGGASYSWSNAATTASITVSPATASAYSVTATDVNGCSGTASSTVNVNSNPVITVAPATNNICAGQSITLTASGAALYSWSNAASGTTISITPFISANYSVTGTDANGCSGTGSASVSVTQSITASATAADVSCSNGSDGAVDITFSGGQAPYTFIWSNGATTQNLSNVAAGNYSFTMNDNTGCGATTSAVVSEPSAITIAGMLQDASCNGGSDGSINLSAAGGTQPFSYQWSDGNLNEDRVNLSAGNYSVIITDANVCTASEDFLVAEPARLNLISTEIDPTCEMNGNDGSISLDANGGTPPYSYLWSNGGTSDFNQNLTASNYTVTVTDDNGCTVYESYTLSYQYVFSVDAGQPATIVIGESTILKYVISGTAGNVSGSWTPTESLEDCDINCDAPVASPEITTLYTVTVTNADGCPETDTVRVYVVEQPEIAAPNAFTPNGDGVNDDFEIYGELETIDFFQAQVYNRWGEKIFESGNPDFKWNGSYRGKALEPDVFVYQIRMSTLSDPEIKVKKGSVTLLR